MPYGCADSYAQSIFSFRGAHISVKYGDIACSNVNYGPAYVPGGLDPTQNYGNVTIKGLSTASFPKGQGKCLFQGNVVADGSYLIIDVTDGVFSGGPDTSYFCDNVIGFYPGSLPPWYGS